MAGRANIKARMAEPVYTDSMSGDSSDSDTKQCVNLSARAKLLNSQSTLSFVRLNSDHEVIIRTEAEVRTAVLTAITAIFHLHFMISFYQL